MAGGIRLTVGFGDLGLTGPVHSLLEAAQNMRPMMEIAGGIFENSTRNRFHTERGPGGIPWPPTWKQKVGAVGPYGPAKNSKTLQDSGLLLGSIRSNVGDRFVETGVDGRSRSARYARVHQEGRTIRPRNAKALAFVGADGHFRMVQKVTIPARPFMGIDQQDVTDLREAFVDYLEAQAE